MVGLGLAGASFCPSAYRELHKSVCLPNNYSSVLMPSEKVEVYMEFTLNNILDVDEMDQKVSLEVFLQLSWTEPRILADPSAFDLTDPDPAVSLDIDVMDLLWMPDMYVDGLLDFKHMKLYKPVGGVNLFPNNVIITSIK